MPTSSIDSSLSLWLHSGLILCLSLHLLAVTLVLGLSLIALSENFKRDPDNQDMLFNISRKLVYIIALTLTLGLASLGVLLAFKSQAFLAAAKLLAPGWRLAAVLALAGYGAAWIYFNKFITLSDRQRLLCSGLSSLGFLTGALIFTTCVGLVRDQSEPFWLRDQAAAWQVLISAPLVWLKFLHLISAALMLGGLAIAVYNESRRRKLDGDFTSRISLGLRWYIWAGLLTIALGLTNLLFSPHSEPFLGGQPFATGLLFVAMTGAILGLIAAIRGHVLNCLAISLVTFLSMILIRELVTASAQGLWPAPAGLSLLILAQVLGLAGGTALIYRYFAPPRL